MLELKQIEIAQKFCQLLIKECTGNRTELAQKLGITNNWVTIYKRKIEEVYHVNINYCRTNKTYFVYENDKKKSPPLFRMSINFNKNAQNSVGVPNELIFVLLN